MKFITKKRTDSFEKIDDSQSDSKKRNKFGKLPPLKAEFLDSVIKGSFYHPDIEAIDAAPSISPQTDLSSIFYEGPCYRPQRLDLLDWAPEHGVLQGDKLTCYVDPGKVQISFSCTVSYVVPQGTGFQNPYLRGITVDSQKLIIFSAPERRTVLAFAEYTHSHEWTIIFTKMLAAKYSLTELENKAAKAENYKTLWAHQVKDTIYRFQQANEEVLQQMEILTGSTVKKIFQSLINFVIPPQFDGAPNSKISLYAILYSATLHFYRRSDDTAQGLSKAFGAIPLQYIMNVTSQGKTVVITTPLLPYTFRCKSDAAAVQWQTVLTKSLTQLHLNVDADDTYINLHGYVYDKCITGKCKLGEIRGLGQKPFRSWKLGKNETTIGRSSSCDVLIADTYLSRCQGKFVFSKNVPYFVDMTGSSFHLNDEKVYGVVPLKPGDILSLGKTFLVFKIKDSIKFSIDKSLAREPKPNQKKPVPIIAVTKKLDATSISEEL